MGPWLGYLPPGLWLTQLNSPSMYGHRCKHLNVRIYLTQLHTKLHIFCYMFWSIYLSLITCRLTAKNWDQLLNPMLGNRVWTTFRSTFFFYFGLLCGIHGWAVEAQFVLVVEELRWPLRKGRDVCVNAVTSSYLRRRCVNMPSLLGSRSWAMRFWKHWRRMWATEFAKSSRYLVELLTCESYVELWLILHFCDLLLQPLGAVVAGRGGGEWGMWPGQ